MDALLLIIALALLIASVALAVLCDCLLNDSRRLNWMERTRSEIDTEGPGFVIYNSINGEENELGGGASKGSFKTIRAAIDSAMEAAKRDDAVKTFQLMQHGTPREFPK